MTVDILRDEAQKIKKNLPTILEQFNQDIDNAPSKLSMIGKTGAAALREQPVDSAYYAKRKAEANKVCKMIEAQMDACRSRLFRKYTDMPSRELSDRAKDKYIDNEPEYLNYLELFLEVKEIYDKLEAVCEAYDRRGFALRDWTTLKVNQLETMVI